jgi:uncharacterized protein
MDLEEFDGFFAALHISPELVLPSEYLPVVLGKGFESGEIFPSKEFAQVILDLVLQYWNAAGGAPSSNDIFVPLRLDDDEGKTHGNNWAIGLLRGVDMRRRAWKEIPDDENKVGWFIPIALA